MIKNIIFVFFFSIICFGCMQNDFEEDLFRTRNDPFYDVPKVDSFSTESIIYLSW